MPGFAGFDRSDYPGDAVMDWLRTNTNLAWCGYYLAPAPSHPGTGWMTRRARLAAAGWGLAPIYVGRQVIGPGARGPSLANGAVDGKATVTLLGGDGFPADTVAYLDIENGPPLTNDQQDYLAAWCDSVRNGGFTPGIYCSHLLAQTAHNLQVDARIWAFNVATTAPHPMPPSPYPTPDPAGCGYPGARVWQLGQACNLSITPSLGGTLQVDLNSAAVADPGSP